ncbi:MAG: GLUG motif-containing protein [Dorea sp.]|nr:GLUG motif-containing protein [Dorea sp.]
MKEKKMKNKIISCLLVLFILSLSLMTQLVVPAYADSKAGEETASADDSKDQADETEAQELKAEEDGTVVISTTEEFLEVAQACSLDTWSQGKTIVLDADISLENTEYLPIPTFGGTFDGKGYTISGLTITNSVTPAGLFGVLQETGVVKNLNVSGDVSPSGDADVVGGIAGENNGTIENCTYTGSISGKQNTGGIAGINGTTGNIKKCNVSGTISGENMTGGIAGYNLGEIASSQNDSYVNIESVDPSLSPEDINLDFLTDVSKLYSLDTSINGDINVGGIVGTMAIEYELDPEDDDTSSVSGRNRREFELKAILIKCCNTGKVSAKRNYTGSVCGHMDLGLISECEGYGDTESENGDYVGGIAGVASGIVRNSYAKCTLKGKNYIGGIVGTGVTADKTGSSSSVTGCYAQVDIPEYEQYAGGISGAEAGEFADNYYVSDDLAAINRMSYSGKAEPIEYSKLLEVEGLPEEFKQLTVQFVAENETLKTVTCNYGESLDDSVYPEIPQRKGYYAKWDITELTDLRFDTVVTAVYSQYTTALEDSKVRDDGRTIFYVEGQFGDGDEADFEEQSQISSDIAVVSTDVSGTLESYFSFLDDASMPSDTISREVVEQWKVTLPDDGLSEHTVRYLAPKGKKDNLDVYVRQDGDVKWEKVETEEVGSYLSFPVSGTISEIAIVSTLPMQWAWAIVIALLLLVLFLLIRMVRKKILRHRARKALEMEVEEMEEADEEESETVESNSETEMNSEESCTYYYTRK